MENYFTVGNIVNTQGIKGEIRIMPTVDDVMRFKLLNKIYVERKGSIKEYDIERVRFHKQFVLLKLKGIDDMTSAEALKGSTAKITEDMALPCEENEYYIKDLYDMSVITEDNTELGIITDILFTGANDVYVISPKEGRDILIPAIKDCILNVDIENKVMTVRIPEGLI